MTTDAIDNAEISLIQRRSPFIVWEDLTPEQQAVIDDISQQMDAAMCLNSGTSKWAILKSIAENPVKKVAP